MCCKDGNGKPNNDFILNIMNLNKSFSDVQNLQ